MAKASKRKNPRKIKASTLEGQVATMSIEKAKSLVARHPDNPEGWKQLGAQLVNNSQYQEALDALSEAHRLAPEDAEVIAVQARTYHQLGDVDTAVHLLGRAIEVKPNYAKAHNYLGYIYYSKSDFDQGLRHAEKACELAPHDVDMYNTLGNILAKRFEYSRAREVLTKATRLEPGRYLSWNNLGNVLSEMGELDTALKSYEKAHKANPAATGPFSNLITAHHYHPGKDKLEILKLCKSWENTFASRFKEQAVETEKKPEKTLRIGMISDGFRGHPVGRMVTSALERVSRDQIEFYLYTTNNSNDAITERLKKVAAKWGQVHPLRDDEVAEAIRGDGVDILIDLAGHNSGNRILAVAQRCAPVQVKWVGGLINTTGVKSIDYLISDHIETPQGCDAAYTEKLIRLPDDYICYDPPGGYEPSVGPLPARRNGYLTLGCFNNATKLNKVVLLEWARIMRDIPASRLLLKGMQYKSEERCQQIIDIMAAEGIGEDRLALEGPSPHAELLDAYNRVDIALDPWPYSGGLTTCEAFLMGVPVVTLPGPTFAGRHSATHLVNAGMPELVVNSWEEYRARVLELASDLDSLATIRTHLRQTLLASPVCDAGRFAKHLTAAMRAIWQRHCGDKTPAALTFNKLGEARFEDEDAPVDIQYAAASEKSDEFQWQFEGKLIAVDNGGRLLENDVIRQLLQREALELIAFDPSSRALETSLKQHQGVHYYPNATLGSGQPGRLHACLDPRLSASLAPLEDEYQSKEIRRGRQVLTRLPLNTIALDSIDGLPAIDWLVLDELSDATTILEHGPQSLKDTLLVQVRVAFQPTHEHQPNLAELQHWASRNGFRFYRLHEPRHHSHLPEEIPEAQRQATELTSADALLIPSHARLADLSDNQRIRLAFLLHTLYGIKDTAHALLVEVSGQKAEGYLKKEVVVGAVGSIGDETAPMAATLSKDAEIRTLAGDGRGVEEAGTVSPVGSAGHTAMAQPLEGADSPSRVSKDQSPLEDGTVDRLWELEDPIYVVDIGANPIDGTPPYAGMLNKGVIELVGFEPQRDALRKLQERKGPHETYLPHAVGDGERAKLYLCQAPGMTSTLKPNHRLLDHFQGYPIWGKVREEEDIDTVRLDDVNDIKKIDWLKIDIQGGELSVFENAEEKLKNALVIQTEVNFIQLYEGQPLFAEIDQWMRCHGFMLHTLLEERKRVYAPMRVNGGIHQGLNQLTTADAVYVRDINKLQGIVPDDIKKMAFIMHEAYGSYDLSLRLLRGVIPDEWQKKYIERVGKGLPLSLRCQDDSLAPLRHLFVVGCGHTGTTLMATILGENKAIHTIKRETSWFLKDGDISQSLVVEEGYAREAGSEWLCEKTPRHVYCKEKIKARLPEAKFVVMTRGAKDVVASIKNRTGDFDHSLSRWIKDNNQAIKVSSESDAILVRYEDLVENPDKVVCEICDFIGVEYTSDMLNYHRSESAWFGVNPKQTDGKGEQAHLERRAWQMSQPIQDRRGVWVEHLTEDEARRVDESCEAVMHGLGYNV